MVIGKIPSGHYHFFNATEMVIKISNNLKIKAAALMSCIFPTIRIPVADVDSSMDQVSVQGNSARMRYRSSLGAWRLLGQMQIKSFIAATVLLASNQLFLFFFFFQGPEDRLGRVRRCLTFAFSSEIQLHVFPK
jgi:hypothetical protein